MQTTTPTFASSLLSLLCCLFMFQKTQAQVFFEPFSYGSNAASLDTLSSFWNAHRGGGNNVIKYETNSLNAPIGLPQASGGCLRFTSGSGSREDLNRTFTAQSSGTVYATFLLQIDSCIDDYFFHFNTFTHIGRIYLKRQNNQLNIACGKTNAPSQYTGTYEFNTRYLLVIKYEFVAGSSNDTVSLWVLPEPSATELDAGVPNSKDHLGNDATSIFAVSIRQGLNAASGRFDELRLATTWEEAVSTQVWNGSSWSANIPNSQTNVKITGNFTPDSTLQVNNLFIENNGKLTLNGKDLYVHGKLSGRGKIAGSNGAGIHIYQSAGTLFTDSLQADFKTVHLHPNASLILGSKLNMQAGSSAGTLTLESHASLQTNNHLTFLSNALGSARLASMPNNAVLSGNICVEKFIPARRAFRFLSSPVTTETGIANAWQLSTHITGNGMGFDSTASKNASLFTLDAGSQDWKPFTNTTTQNLVQGEGYRILIRGDRSINLYSNSALPSTCTLKAIGFHQTGDKTYNSSSNPAISDSVNGWSLIGNPFPSAINWDLVSKNQISSTYYTWRAQGGSNNRGAYVSYNASGQTSSDGNVNNILSSGAAIMIKTTGSNPSLTIKESDKIAANEGHLILGKNAGNGIRISLFEYDSVLTDAMYIFSHPNASHLKDEFDAEKWMNPGASLFAVDSLDNAYAIMSLSLNATPKIIHLKLKNTEIKSYQFKIKAGHNFEKNWWLIDQYLGKEMELDTSTQYSFEVTDNPASKDENRFILSNKKPLENSLPNTETPNFSIYPNPSNGVLQVSTKQYLGNLLNYSICNLQGKIIQHGTVGSDQIIDTSNIGSGLFVLTLQSQTFTHSYKFMNQ